MCLVMCVILPRLSECGTDRELEALDLVRITDAVALELVQRDAMVEVEVASGANHWMARPADCFNSL